MRAVEVYLQRSGLRFRITKKGDAFSVRCFVDQDRAPFLPLANLGDAATFLELMGVTQEEIRRALADVRAKGVGNIPAL